MAAHGKNGEALVAYRRIKNKAKLTNLSRIKRREYRAKKAADLQAALDIAKAEVAAAVEKLAAEAAEQAELAAIYGGEVKP